jgi:hypothetical protein
MGNNQRMRDYMIACDVERVFDCTIDEFIDQYHATIDVSTSRACGYVLHAMYAQNIVKDTTSTHDPMYIALSMMPDNNARALLMVDITCTYARVAHDIECSDALRDTLYDRIMNCTLCDVFDA